MKKSILLLMLSLCIVAVSSPADALTLSLDPSNQTVNSGDDVFLNLVVSGLTAGGPDSLGAFQADVFYDEALFGFSNVTFGTSLGDPNDYFETDAWFDDSIPGNIYLDEISFLLDFELDALQGESFTLATLQFSSIDLGIGSFELANVVLSDAIGYDLLPIDSLQNASVTSSVAPVPEPTTMLLLGTGLVGLAGFRKKYKKN